jgi:hypothetical protein
MYVYICARRRRRPVRFRTYIIKRHIRLLLQSVSNLLLELRVTLCIYVSFYSSKIQCFRDEQYR